MASPKTGPREGAVPATPIWTLDELVAIYDVEAIDGDRFRGATIPPRIRPDEQARTVVEGSLILGQAIVAASRAESNRFVKSAHMIFARGVNTSGPVELVLDRLHSGRGFSSLTVTAEQGGRACARGMFLLDTNEPDLVAHAAPMPEVADPGASTPYDMSVEGREVRFVEGADYADPDAVGRPGLDIWVRYAAAPEDAAVRQALVADFCGPFIIGASMRPHPGLGQDQAHGTLSTGVLSLTVRFHAPPVLDDWLLYANESIHAGRGLCDGKGRIFDRSGRLIASFEQEGLLRPLPARVAQAQPRKGVL